MVVNFTSTKIAQSYRTKLLAVSVLWIYLTGILGCGSTRIIAPPYMPPASTAQHRIGDENVEIGIYVLRDPIEQRDYFATDFTEMGIMPVWVTVKNKSADKWFLVDPADIRIGIKGSSLPDSNTNDPIMNKNTSNNAMGTVGAVGLSAGALLISPALVFISLQLLLSAAESEWVADELKRRIESNRLYVRTLFQNESASGFIYIKATDIGALESQETEMGFAVRQLPLNPDTKPMAYRIQVGRR